MTTPLRFLTQSARAGAHAVAEMNYAQHRAIVLIAAPDRFVPAKDRDKAPDNFAEFMYRTSGPLLREPSAGRRANGQIVR